MAVTISIKTRYDGKGTKQAKDDLNAFEKQARKIGSTLAAGFVASQVFEFGRESLNLAREQAAAEAQLAATLRSTGFAAGLSARELKAMAGELQNLTNFGDEATLQGQALLLTFTNIGRDVFPRAVRSMLDMSEALDQDLKASAIQLGKALNDPVQGVTALQRVGVSFTDAQRDTIEALAETNRTADAQALILSELERQFGGSAEAAREADGGFTALGNTFGDLREEIGFVIADLNKAIGATDGLSGVIQSLINDTQDLRVGLGGGDLSDQIEVLERDIAERQAVIDRAREEGPGWLDLLFGGEDQFEKDLAVLERMRDDQQAILDELLAQQAAEDQAAKEQAEQARQEQAAVEVEGNEEVLERRRAFARELIEIQRDADRDLSDAAEDLADAQEDAQEDHLERMGDLARDHAKDRLKIQQDLAQDLAKAEADLQKRLQKQQVDEQKKIDRIQEDAAKEERRQRRLDRVDALADERLFQLELEHLAARGEGIAIKEALERRAIEEEIAREKASVEQDIEQERREDEIERIRDEGRERREQLQLDAQEREQIIQERNAEEVAALEERIAEELMREGESYADRIADLDEHYQDRVQAIEEGEAEGVQRVAEGLSEIEDLTTTEFQRLADVARDFGEDTGEAFAEGMLAGFESNRRINQLLGGGNAPSTGGQDFGRIEELMIPGVGFQHGGAFRVGGRGGADSQVVAFRATPGEEVAISPQGSAIVIDGQRFAAPQAERLAAAIEAHMQRTMQQFADQFAERLGVA